VAGFASEEPPSLQTGLARTQSSYHLKVAEDKAAQLKQAAAEFAAGLVEDGMLIGLGTGSTAYHLVAALGRRVQQGLRITGVPTSEKTASQARSLGIPISDLGEHPQLDLTIDGADEVEPGSLNLLKGLGGALLREKIVASASKQMIVIVDDSKIVDRLGSRAPVPVEVIPFGWQAVEKRLKDLGAVPTLRKNPTGEPFVTDGAHYILDCVFGPIADANELALKMDRMVGIVDHGLFLGIASRVLIGKPSGIETLLPSGR
jgi:ribose 5-phosphate isomerase A